MSKYGFLSKLFFLQDIVSSVLSSDGAILHNIEKYIMLNKIFCYTSMEGIKGDYLEFGVYNGSSFVCAMKCCKKILNIVKQVDKYQINDKINEWDMIKSILFML